MRVRRMSMTEARRRTRVEALDRNEGGTSDAPLPKMEGSFFCPSYQSLGGEGVQSVAILASSRSLKMSVDDLAWGRGTGS